MSAQFLVDLESRRGWTRNFSKEHTSVYRWLSSVCIWLRAFCEYYANISVCKHNVMLFMLLID